VYDIKEKHKLGVFENRAPRRMFGPKRDEIIRGWRKLHKEELRNFHSTPNIIRMIKTKRMRCVGRVTRIEEKRNAYWVLVGKSE
jgi:hypothetical protein